MLCQVNAPLPRRSLGTRRSAMRPYCVIILVLRDVPRFFKFAKSSVHYRMMGLRHRDTVTGGTTYGWFAVYRATVPPAGVPGFGSVSKVEMMTPMALIYKALFPSIST